jgi:mono/diheme cytochrome c family protein
MGRTLSCGFAALMLHLALTAPLAAADLAADLTEGKKVFESTCGACHGLNQALGKRDGLEGWTRTVKRMVTNGAGLDERQTGLVAAYLAANSTFETKCSACHGSDRPLGKNRSLADWTATVQRMGQKRAGHLTEGQVAEIATFLSVIRPPKP